MSTTAALTIAEQFAEQFPVSAGLYDRACQIFPDGVTHDARFLKPFPVCVERAQGSRKTTADGVELIDYWMGHGSLLLGHAHPALVEAVTEQVRKGTHYGASHELEAEWGAWVTRLKPSCERVRFVNSGSEATLMALRIARIVTGRNKVVKFAGHFHGWHDLLIPAADGPYDTGDFSMPGVTSGVMADLVVVPPNDLETVERAFDEHKPACVILEATGGHWGLVPMRGGFLRGLDALCRDKGVLLIFDEVITGFRVCPGGSQGYYGLRPDLTAMAKVLAGGLPGGALGGREDLMDALEFDNPYGKKMRHPGTYNGNPLSAAAGVATLAELALNPHCPRANAAAGRLRRKLNALFAQREVDWVVYGEFSYLAILPQYRGPRPPATMDDDPGSSSVERKAEPWVPHQGNLLQLDRKIDPRLTHAFRCALLLQGVDMFGWRMMLSSAHSDDDIDQTVAAFDRAIDMLRAEGLVG